MSDSKASRRDSLSIDGETLYGAGLKTAGEHLGCTEFGSSLLTDIAMHFSVSAVHTLKGSPSLTGKLTLEVDPVELKKVDPDAAIARFFAQTLREVTSSEVKQRRLHPPERSLYVSYEGSIEHGFPYRYICDTHDNVPEPEDLAAITTFVDFCVAALTNEQNSVTVAPKAGIISMGGVRLEVARLKRA